MGLRKETARPPSIRYEKPPLKWAFDAIDDFCDTLLIYDSLMIDDCAVLHRQTDMLTQLSMSLNPTSMELLLLFSWAA